MSQDGLGRSSSPAPGTRFSLISETLLAVQAPCEVGSLDRSVASRMDSQANNQAAHGFAKSHDATERTVYEPGIFQGRDHETCGLPRRAGERE